MKVLEVVPVRRISAGPVAVVKSVASRLTGMGYHVSVLSPGGYDDTASQFLDMGVRVVSSLGELRRTASRPDLVHFHGALNPRFIPVGFHCRRQSIPYIVSPHGNLMPQALSHNWLKKKVALETILRWYLGRARCYHALCSEEADAILALYPRVDVRVIHNGVDIGEMPMESMSRSQHTKPRTIAFLGRIDVPHKGIDLLLDGAIQAALRPQVTHDVRIRIAGMFASEHDKSVFEDLMSRGASALASYVGPKYGSEKTAFLRDCDAFIHTSRYEGMPMAILEAMAEGKPCIVTRGTNMADIVSRCDGGWVIGSDPASISEMLAQVSSVDEAVLHDKGSRCLRWCKENHNWGALVKQYDNMYRSVADCVE